MNANGKQPIGQYSIDVKTLVDQGKEVAVSGMWLYDEMRQATGRNPQGSLRSALGRARRILERDYNVVFGVVKNVCLMHLTDEETIKSGQPTIDHIRRMSKRAGRRITSLKDPTSVRTDLQLRQYTELSLFLALAHMTTGKQVARLEKKIKESKKELPLAKTLEAFKE